MPERVIGIIVAFLLLGLQNVIADDLLLARLVDENTYNP